MATIGVEWVNDYHGRASNLKNNDDNARGFYNTLTGVRAFEYGDDMAWDQDFEESGVGVPSIGSDAVYADAVDIVFFSGHGSIRGPSFGVAERDSGTGGSAELRLGNLNCDWAVFDACQILDESNVLGRLNAAFAGLHMMLGFHTICSDSGDRGRIFAERLNAGWSMRDAWIRACTETEDYDTQWAYLRAEGANVDTFLEGWPGHGVSAGPVSPGVRIYLRGSC